VQRWWEAFLTPSIAASTRLPLAALFPIFMALLSFAASLNDVWAMPLERFFGGRSAAAPG